MNAWTQRWGNLWRTCVGWDRGTSISIKPGAWCVMFNGNRVGPWHEMGSD